MLILDSISIIQRDKNHKDWKILNNFSLKVIPGNPVCLVGEEGSGVQELFDLLKMKDRENYKLYGKISSVGGDKTAYLSLSTEYLNLSGSPYGLLRILTLKNSSKSSIQARYLFLTKQYGIELKTLKKKFSKLTRHEARIAYYSLICVLDYDYIFVSNTNSIADENYLKFIMDNATTATVIFSSNNLGNARLSSITYVLYGGEVIEIGKPYEILYNPRHPYLWSLLTSLSKRDVLEVDVSFGYLPKITLEVEVDVYSSRNKYALEIDFEKKPLWTQLSKTHFTKTWLEDERAKGLVKPPLEITSRWKFFEEHYGT